MRCPRLAQVEAQRHRTHFYPALVVLRLFFSPLFKSRTYAEYALRARARSAYLACWQRTLGGASYASGKARRLCSRRQHSLTGTPALTHWHASTHSLARLHSLAGTRAPGGGPRLHLALERALQAPQSGAHVRAVLRYSRHCGMLEQTHGRAYVTVARAGSPVADACASASRGFVICQRGNKRW